MGLFRHFYNLFYFFADTIIILTPVRNQTTTAILDTLFCIREMTAALISEGIQGTEAEKATKAIRICIPMAGKIFTFFVLKKIVMTHNAPPQQSKCSG